MDSFVDPPWDDPLDVDAVLARIPANEVIKGMFLQPMIAAAKAKGLTLPGARDRYVAFQDYPLREHAELLVTSARTMYPQLSLRQGLCRLGRGAQAALTSSTVGRVIWSTAIDAPTALAAIAKAYGVAHPTSDVSIVDTAPQRVILRVARIWWFLDSHHVGCFEGAMKSVGVEGTVKLALTSWSDGELACTWLCVLRLPRLERLHHEVTKRGDPRGHVPRRGIEKIQSRPPRVQVG